MYIELYLSKFANSCKTRLIQNGKLHNVHVFEVSVVNIE